MTQINIWWMKAFHSFDHTMAGPLSTPWNWLDHFLSKPFISRAVFCLSWNRIPCNKVIPICTFAQLVKYRLFFPNPQKLQKHRAVVSCNAESSKSCMRLVKTMDSWYPDLLNRVSEGQMSLGITYLSPAPRWCWWLPKSGESMWNLSGERHQLCRCGLSRSLFSGCEMVRRQTASFLLHLARMLYRPKKYLNFLICGSERMRHALLVFMQAWEVCLICCIEWLACVLTLCSHVCGVAEPRAEKQQGWINLSHVWASWWHILAGLTTLDTQPPSSEKMNS